MLATVVAVGEVQALDGGVRTCLVVVDIRKAEAHDISEETPGGVEFRCRQHCMTEAHGTRDKPRDADWRVKRGKIRLQSPYDFVPVTRRVKEPDHTGEAAGSQ